MNNRSMAGWIGFAGIVMLIIGFIDFFQGLIALFKDDYYVVTQSGFLAINLRSCARTTRKRIDREPGVLRSA